MAVYSNWCKCQKLVVQDHDLRVETADDGKLDLALEAVSAVVSEHYAAPSRLARIFERHGSKGVAEYLDKKLPREKKGRSGDLGEVLATEYIEEKLDFTVPIRRLRWSDHREMAMRGEDVLGVRLNKKGDVAKFLKAESKSRASLKTAHVEEARAGVDRDEGLPSPHSLSFVADRLNESGNEQLADAIDDAQLRTGIRPGRVENLIFVFSGNDPKSFLEADLKTYSGKISQVAIGVRVKSHQKFIEDVFVKAASSNE